MNWPLMNNAVNFNDKIKLIYFILKSNRYTNGEKVKSFEKQWSDWLGCKHSLFVSSGSTANFLLINAIKEYYELKDNDKVLVPSCTWMTSVAPIFQNKLNPVFVDVSLNDYCIELKDLEIIKEKHPDIKLIFTTHLMGFRSSIEDIKKVFPNAILAEDCCEAHGVKNDSDEKFTSLSEAMTFSFYYGHHMTTIEGGMISTNNENLYELMRMKRSHGLAREASSSTFEKYKIQNPNIIPSFLFVTDGFNFRNNEISAILGSEQLKRLNKNIKIRNKNYFNFHNLISQYSEFFHLPLINNNMSSFNFPIVCKNEKIYDNLISNFRKYKVEFRPLVAGNLLKQPFLKNYKFDYDKTFFNADIIHEYGLYIGNNQFVNQKHLNLLTKILKETCIK